MTRNKSLYSGQSIAGVAEVQRKEWEADRVVQGTDQVIEEVPVALVYNGISHVVMMVTPCDLDDFALGFSLSEGILNRPDELLSVESNHHAKGIELHLSILSQRFEALKQLSLIHI